jgi:uncharacterized membrane protein
MDPITAFAAVQATVKMIKQASATANDVASLGPLIGKYFDTKHQATVAVRETKKAGGSNMGKAIEIELALKSQADFEKELKDLFFASGNLDIWNNIMQRVVEMDQDDKLEADRERARAKKAKQRQQQINEYLLAGGIVVVMLVFCVWGLTEFVGYCQARGRCA